MSSWSCPFFDEKGDWCRRLDAACVPGRGGCVLPRNLRFAVPPSQRGAPPLRRRAEDDPPPSASDESSQAEGRPPRSMHDGVETWCDTCSCEPEPRWAALGEELQREARRERGD